MNSARLQTLERRAAQLHADARLTVQFSDGTRRTMRAADVIPLFVESGGLAVEEVTGDTGAGSGKLLELLRGLLEGSK